MHFKLLVLFALVSIVRNHDVSIGSDGGRKIFEDTRFASPAIWRQVENVTVIAPKNEVISKVNITDMRADKDGDVDIVDGGEGKKSVTIEIKSPTVLRGYEFHIEVFSVPESNFKTSENADTPKDMPEDILNYEYKTTPVPQNSDSERSETNKDIPTSIANDSDSLRPARQTNDVNDIPEMSEGSETKIESTTETIYEESTTTEIDLSEMYTGENNDEMTESVEGSGSDDSAQIIPSDWLRPARDLTDIPVENDATITTTEISNEYTTIEDILTPDDSDNQDSTTETLEVVPVDSDVVRPARETSNKNELTVSITETANMETTEGSLKANDDDNTMSTPDMYVNSKDIPDYSALSILDYIKNKEQGNRQIRRTEEKDTSDTQSSEQQINENEDSSSTTEGPNSTIESDDTVDLVPPEVDAPYNDNFTPDLGSSDGPIESSTSYTNSRKARRYELPDEFYATPTSEGPTTLAAASEDSTPMAEDATTESSLEQKSRNSRNTVDNLENSYNFNLTSEAESNYEPNSVAKNDKVSSGIVLLKGDRVIITADGKQVEFTLPIVLIVGNENNFPIFKLIEESIDTEKKDLDESKIGLNDTPDVTMDYEVREAANDFARNDEYTY